MDKFICTLAHVPQFVLERVSFSMRIKLCSLAWRTWILSVPMRVPCMLAFAQSCSDPDPSSADSCHPGREGSGGDKQGRRETTPEEPLCMAEGISLECRRPNPRPSHAGQVPGIASLRNLCYFNFSVKLRVCLFLFSPFPVG